jgi:cyanophycinase
MVFPRGAVAALLALPLLAACGSEAANDGPRVIVSDGPVYEVPARAAPPVKPVAQHPGRGSLILEGGGIGLDATSELTVAYAGPKPVLCLIDTAEQGKGDPYLRFDNIGGMRMLNLDITARNAGDIEVTDALKSCTGYYFNGGNPELLSRNLLRGLDDSPALGIIRAKFERGGAVVSGTSAGAMIVGPVTLCECGSTSSVHALTEGRLYEAPGYRFVDGLLVDAHFFARGLIGRHLYALADTKEPVGVGIDETTAVIVPGDGGLWQVIGDSSVALIRRGPGSTVDHLSGFTISLLNAGDRFDPHSGKIVVAPSRKAITIGDDPTAAPTEASDIFAPDRLRQLILAFAASPSATAEGFAQAEGLMIQLRKRSDTAGFSDGSSLTVLNLEVGAGKI